MARRYTKFGFITAVARHLHDAHDGGQRGFNFVLWCRMRLLASDVVERFFRDEGVEFGHPDYMWDYAGAGDLAREMEIDHWEAA